MRHSLQAKLLVSFMLVIVILLGGALWGVSVVVKDHAIASRQENLQDKGIELAATLKNTYLQQGNFQNVDTLLADADSFLGARIWVVDYSHTVACMSGGMGPGHSMHMGNNHMGMRQSANQMGAARPGAMSPAVDKILEPAFQQGTIQTQTINHPYYGESMQVVAVPVKLDDGTIPAVVMLMGPMSAISSYMKQIYIYLFIAGIVAIIAALLIVVWLSRKLVKPLKEMQETADAMAKGNYKSQVAVTSDDEVGHLGESLNSLARDLDKYMTELATMEKLRRDFTANVSHELRTPLTIIRGYDEALLEGAAEDSETREKYCRLIHDETLRLERLIHELLDLSRLQSSKEATDTERIPLAELAEGVLTKFRQLAGLKDVTLSLATPGQQPVMLGNGDRITQLVMIFLDNAIKYTQPGGTVSVRVVSEDDKAVMTVSDTGKGIPEADLPYIWERFYKVDKSHRRDDSGTGLGLSIARQIIDLHQGTVAVASTEGQGTTFTLRFPLAK